jgi:hypothetical protein
MKEYPNFYENLKEAYSRLARTIVLYDGLPYHAIALTDNKEDGIIRIWLDPIGVDMNDGRKQLVYTALSYNGDYAPLGSLLDTLLEKYPDCGILRKHMNSPKFNRFRPFPLGMCNVGTQVYYVERQPIRPLMHQGLVKSACLETLITAGSRQDNPRRQAETLDITSKAFKDCILGDHFTPRETLAALLNPRVAHDALAFHREFALVRGPIDMLFLAYRSEIIGVLPNNSFDFLKLGKEYGYCREVVEELDLFRKIL